MKTETGRLDIWPLGLEPEGPISMAESCWETVWTLLFDPCFASSSLCRDVVSWPGWRYGASTMRRPRTRPQKQPGAGQARRVCQTVTLRCGSCCRGRRIGSVVVWNSLPQRWDLGRGASAWATIGTGTLLLFLQISLLDLGTSCLALSLSNLSVL